MSRKEKPPPPIEGSYGRMGGRDDRGGFGSGWAKGSSRALDSAGRARGLVVDRDRAWIWESGAAERFESAALL